MLTLRYAAIGDLESLFHRVVESQHLMKGGGGQYGIDLRALRDVTVCQLMRLASHFAGW